MTREEANIGGQKLQTYNDLNAGIANLVGIVIVVVLCALGGSLFSYIMSRIFLTRQYLMKHYDWIL